MLVTSLLAHAALLARLAGPYPFDVGETLRYNVRLGFVPVGTASASVVRLARERGIESFVFQATGEGGPRGAQVRYDLTSWVDKRRFHSLRFHRHMVQRNAVQDFRYHIVPDSARYRREGTRGAWSAPKQPLDELAFLYYLRTIKLQTGKTYTSSRYFHKGYNPITIRVNGRDTLKLDSGRKVLCFSLTLRARDTEINVWLTDDDRRLPVQLELPLWFGNARLKLAE